MKLSDKFSNEYHAFWSKAVEFGYIFLVSETNYDGDPGQVQFFTITNRDETRQQLRITFGDASAEDSMWFVADQGGNMFGTLEPVMGDQDTLQPERILGLEPICRHGGRIELYVCSLKTTDLYVVSGKLGR